MISSPPEAPEDFGIDIPSMNPDYALEEVTADRGHYSYGLRPRTYGAMQGWVVQLPYQDNLRMQYTQRKFTYLDQYGLFLIAQADGDIKKITCKDANGQPWNSFREPWRLLFQRGGAKEFPVEQIVTNHWHLMPPYREATFPQIEGLHIHDFQCPECYERPVVFSSLNQRLAAVQLRTHLTSRVNETHSYTPNDLKELGTELGIDLISARVAVPRMIVSPPSADGIDLPDTLGAIEPLAPEVPVDLSEALNRAYQCDQCGWAPLATNKAPQLALAQHRKRAHK